MVEHTLTLNAYWLPAIILIAGTLLTWRMAEKHKKDPTTQGFWVVLTFGCTLVGAFAAAAVISIALAVGI